MNSREWTVSSERELLVIKVSSRRDQINVAKAYSAGQEHIFAWWEELTEKER